MHPSSLRVARQTWFKRIQPLQKLFYVCMVKNTLRDFYAISEESPTTSRNFSIRSRSYSLKNSLFLEYFMTDAFGR